MQRLKQAARGKKKGYTHNRPHGHEQQRGDASQKAAQYLPARHALHLAAGHDDQKPDQGRELNDDGKRHEEARGAPYAAEATFVPGAVFTLHRERPAGRRVRERIDSRRASLVQADIARYRVPLDRGYVVADPVGQDD